MTTTTTFLPVNCSRFQPSSTDNPYDLPALCLVDADQADTFSTRRLYTTSTGLVTWTQMVRDGDQRLEFNQSIAEQVLGLENVPHGRIQHLNGDRLDCRRANMSVSVKGDRRVKAVHPGSSFHQTEEFKAALAHRLSAAELTRLAGAGSRSGGLPRRGAPAKYTDAQVVGLLNYLLDPKEGFEGQPLYGIEGNCPESICPRMSVPTLRKVIDGELYRQPDHLVDYAKLAQFFPSPFAKRAKKRALIILADQAALEKRSRDLNRYLDQHNLTFKGTLVVNGTHTAAAAPSPAEQSAATP
jgi:hypothetical protein